MKLIKNESGMNILLIPFIMTIVLLLTAIGVATWAFVERDTYKNKTDEVVAKEVQVAVDRAKSDKDNEFVQKEKEPYRQYTGPESFGSFTLSYPKTWSVYEDNSSNGTKVLLHPAVVPSGDDVSLATTVEVDNTNYENELKKYESSVKTGTVKASPYALPKVPSVKGMRFEGELPGGKKTGIVVVLPLRDKSIRISSESSDYYGDYNGAVLATFNFVP